MQNDMECQKSVDVFKEFGNFYVKLLHRSMDNSVEKQEIFSHQIIFREINSLVNVDFTTFLPNK